MLPGPLVDALDLVLGRACTACGQPGRALCSPCLGALRGRAAMLPTMTGLPPTAAAAHYDALPRRLVLEYKEQGNRALGPMLGVLLADAVAVHLRGRVTECVELVPIPGHRRPARGFDALRGIVNAATAALRDRRYDVDVRRCLGVTAGYQPMKGLDRPGRIANIDGAFRARMAPEPGRVVIVVDDVLTTGSTMREAVRTLRGSGAQVTGAAVVAVTTRDTSLPPRAPARPTTPP